MTPLLSNPDQRDALQEIVNVGMGSAGAALGAVLETFVLLSVPRVELVELDDLSHLPWFVGWTDDAGCAIRQGFYEGLDGEVVVLFGRDGLTLLAEKLGYAGEGTDAIEAEVLLDFSNVLVGACMNGIGVQLGLQLSFSPPSMLSMASPVSAVLRAAERSLSALMINVTFAVQDCSFTSQLLILLPQTSIVSLTGAVSRFMDSL